MSLRQRALDAQRRQQEAERSQAQERTDKGEESRSKEVDRFIPHLQRLCEEAADGEGANEKRFIRMDLGTFKEPVHPETSYTILSPAYQRLIDAIGEIKDARPVIITEPMDDQGQGRSWTNYWIGAAW